MNLSTNYWDLGQGAPDDDDLEGEEEISASKGETKKDAEEEEVEEKKE